MTANTFDSLAVARKLKDTGLDRAQAEAVSEELHAAAGTECGGLLTRRKLYRALWIQGGTVVAILTGLRFLPI